MNKLVRRSGRSAFGSQLFELLCGTFILLFVALLLFDLTILVEGVSLNNTVCREAARAAASGAPDALSMGAPRERAEATVKKYAKSQGNIQIHPDCLVTEIISMPLPKKPAGGAVVGQTTVETVVEVNIPFKPWPLPSKAFTFTARQTYPYTYTLPAEPVND